LVGRAPDGEWRNCTPGSTCRHGGPGRWRPRRTSARLCPPTPGQHVSQPLGADLIDGQRCIHAAPVTSCVGGRPSLRCEIIESASIPASLNSTAHPGAGTPHHGSAEAVQARRGPASGQSRSPGSGCPLRLPSPPKRRHFEGSSGVRPHTSPSVTSVRLTDVEVTRQADDREVTSRSVPSMSRAGSSGRPGAVPVSSTS
jgi:hypothetical protein